MLTLRLAWTTPARLQVMSPAVVYAFDLFVGKQVVGHFSTRYSNALNAHKMLKDHEVTARAERGK